ncbi:hypothetical protein BZA77DRAFT_340751 [Pyronema omphalodes]|nr:hypothetical protein BZA77DRAFT_340751 [Pyronema omphalodes]
MPILRRYVRVTQFTVLEARIFLPSPSDAAWISRNNALALVFSTIKPYVLPMLQEAKVQQTTGAARVKEQEKVEVVTVTRTCNNYNRWRFETDYQMHAGRRPLGSVDEFTASLYLTRAGTIHAVLRKDRKFEERRQQDVRGDRSSTAANNKLTDEAKSPPVIIRQESPEAEETLDLGSIPEAGMQGEEAEEQDETPLFLPGLTGSSDDEDEDFRPPQPRSQMGPPPPKKNPGKSKPAVNDDKKKLKFTTDYEGFTIYDKVLCIVITRPKKATSKGKEKEGEKRVLGGGLIEGWISMSQAVRDGNVIEVLDGDAQDGE